MTSALATIGVGVFVGAGLFFFVAGTVGLLRFPDPHSRLHALTKADNLGLGLLAIGVALHLGSGWAAAKLALIWVLAVFAASTAAQLLARSVLRDEDRPAPSNGNAPSTTRADPDRPGQRTREGRHGAGPGHAGRGTPPRMPSARRRARPGEA